LCARNTGQEIKCSQLTPEWKEPKNIYFSLHLILTDRKKVNSIIIWKFLLWTKTSFVTKLWKLNVRKIGVLFWSMREMIYKSKTCLSTGHSHSLIIPYVTKTATTEYSCGLLCNIKCIWRLFGSLIFSRYYLIFFSYNFCLMVSIAVYLIQSNIVFNVFGTEIMNVCKNVPNIWWHTVVHDSKRTDR
jgi:hypothetical protein